MLDHTSRAACKSARPATDVDDDDGEDEAAVVVVDRSAAGRFVHAANPKTATNDMAKYLMGVGRYLGHIQFRGFAALHALMGGDRSK